ncbi:hypothetical protein GW17_00019475 [Ensete ventricosum]|nr:hypothetical protein GW17_00019475 [Ensete ventricosum]
MFVIHRLFLMLKRFPVESKGRLKKLQEVSMNFSTLHHSVTRGFFFCFLQFVEILPSALVLFILRKLPPKRGITQYHPIH